MLREAFRNGLAAARAAGWRAYALALLSYAPVTAAQALGSAPLVLGTILLQLVVALALIRLLGARRPEPVPAPPQVDEQGRRVLPPRQPGPPLGEADRRLAGALANAFRLWRPAIAFAGLLLLANLAGLLSVLALSGGRATEYSARVVVFAALPVSSLFLAFIALAPQRIALEGETRVLVAAAHSTRIARNTYGPLLLLTLAEPLATSLGSLLVPEQNPPVGQVVGAGAATVVVAALLQVVVTAVLNELYLTGPRLDLAVDPDTT